MKLKRKRTLLIIKFLKISFYFNTGKQKTEISFQTANCMGFGMIKHEFRLIKIKIKIIYVYKIDD
jgi:hypothetical protein